MAGRKYLPIALLALVLLPNALAESDDHDPESNTYDIVDGSGKVCMKFELAAEFHVDYLTTENTSDVAHIVLPAADENGTSIAGSRCLSRTDGSEGGLHVSFGKGFFFGIAITVSNNGSDVKWTVSAMRLAVDFSDSTYFTNATDQSMGGFETTDVDINSFDDSGYSCLETRTLVMAAVNGTGSPEPGEKTATVTFSNLTVNPFNSKELTTCGPSKDKSASRIVPIAVGSALAGLLLLVVIAYVINRRTGKRGGYEKV